MYESALESSCSLTPRSVRNGRPLPKESRHILPPVPVLPETMVRVELLLAEPAVELGLLTKAVLMDLGATLQLLRNAGQSGDSAEDRALRIESSIVCLGRESLVKAMPTVLDDANAGEAARIRDFWHTSRLAAELCCALARQAGDLDPEKAYLAGLLFQLGKLPDVLGWKTSAVMGNSTIRRAQWLIETWTLPRFLNNTICGDDDVSGLGIQILRAATALRSWH